jgi:hypothetical protein
MRLNSHSGTVWPRMPGIDQDIEEDLRADCKTSD